MALSVHHITRALIISSLAFFLYSCATYNTRIERYYERVVSNQYQKADDALDKNKLLQQRRNRLLYLLEKGKISHLLKDYEASNSYFNEADHFIEDVRTSAKDIALGTLLNPMMQTYQGEDFEKFMVHYYKALNYLYLGLPDEALVEARRISLRNYAQQDKNNEKRNRFSDDAFSLMLQGIIYEQSGDINNAFISYRNAADVFLEHDGLYYGVIMPEQLKQDVLRMAYRNGFTDQVQRYEELLHASYQPSEQPEGGELVLFWENGLAPVKREESFFFTLTEDGLGNFVFTNGNGAINVPFNFSSYIKRDAIKLEELRSLRVAFPRYEEQPVYYTNGAITINNTRFNFEKAEDVNTLAFATLKERFLKEMTQTLTRLAVKKLAQAAARPKEDAKNKDTKEAVAFAIQVFNFVSEKADTRNWQSLPHTIHYTRVPLQKGQNNISIELSGRNAATHTINLSIEGTGKLQVRNICTLR